MQRDIFARLYAHHYDGALLYALSLCRDLRLAEDLVQEAFLRAYQDLPDEIPSFRYWLMRVLRNLLIDYHRRQKFLSGGEVPEQADDGTPERTLLQREDVLALYRAMAKLTEPDREILSLFYFAGLPVTELAQLLRLTPGAVKMRLVRLRRRLRTEMKEDGYEF